MDDLVFYANSNKKTLQYFKIISEVGGSCTYRILVLKSLRELINYWAAIYLLQWRLHAHYAEQINEYSLFGYFFGSEK